jgi:hypothetical protein
MATFTKNHLSGSTDGKLIKVVATATAGTVIHTGPTDTAHFHEVWLYATNNSATDRLLTIEWGGVASPDDLIDFTVKSDSGLFLIIPGLVLQGNASALVVRAFCAAAANTISVGGYVNEIS